MSCATLGKTLNVSVQQIQKYEYGENRVSAGLLFEIGRQLGVKPSHFYEGLEPFGQETSSAPPVGESLALLADRQIVQLAFAFIKLRDRSMRRRLVALVESVSDDAGTGAVS